MWNPLSWAMEVAAIIAIALLDYVDFILIVGLLLLNATISYREEASADKVLHPSHTTHMHTNAHPMETLDLGLSYGEDALPHHFLRTARPCGAQEPWPRLQGLLAVWWRLWICSVLLSTKHKHPAGFGRSNCWLSSLRECLASVLACASYPTRVYFFHYFLHTSLW
jgi:hypothetical protein